MNIDPPLDVTCGYCLAPPGQPCTVMRTWGNWKQPTTPHLARKADSMHAEVKALAESAPAGSLLNKALRAAKTNSYLGSGQVSSFLFGAMWTMQELDQEDSE